MVAVPKKVAVRLSKEVTRYQKILQVANDRDVNEADTVTIITDIFADVCGFDKYVEITAEQAIRGTFCDLAIKIDGAVKLLIEVKAVGMTLKENHLRQVINYGANHGIQWVILTNGINWEIHRLRFERPVGSDLICAFNFLELNGRRDEDQYRLFLLCKEGLSKAAIEEFHEHVKSVNRFTIGAVLRSETVLKEIRRELRVLSPGLKVTNEEIEQILTNEVLKREVVDGESAERARTKVKKISGRRKSSQRTNSGHKAKPEKEEVDNHLKKDGCEDNT